MKQVLRRMISEILSILTTFMIMAAPVAAMVYAAEPTAAFGGPGNRYTAQVVSAGLYGAPARNARPQTTAENNDRPDRHPESAETPDRKEK
ncbi:MAG TPA: hypothetical protein PKA10_00715 [Selenomonadales bacterium]|nr:hypothetical protein [Selenomonadales bacterium]